MREWVRENNDCNSCIFLESREPVKQCRFVAIIALDLLFYCDGFFY